MAAASYNKCNKYYSKMGHSGNYNLYSTNFSVFSPLHKGLLNDKIMLTKIY